MNLAESEHLSLDAHGRLWLETARWISNSCSGSSPSGASSMCSAEPSRNPGPAAARPCCLGPAGAAIWPSRLGLEPEWFVVERNQLTAKWDERPTGGAQ